MKVDLSPLLEKEVLMLQFPLKTQVLKKSALLQLHLIGMIMLKMEAFNSI